MPPMMPPPRHLCRRVLPERSARGTYHSSDYSSLLCYSMLLKCRYERPAPCSKILCCFTLRASPRQAGLKRVSSLSLCRRARWRRQRARLCAHAAGCPISATACKMMSAARAYVATFHAESYRTIWRSSVPQVDRAQESPVQRHDTVFTACLLACSDIAFWPAHQAEASRGRSARICQHLLHMVIPHAAAPRSHRGDATDDRAAKRYRCYGTMVSRRPLASAISRESAARDSLQSASKSRERPQKMRVRDLSGSE